MFYYLLERSFTEPSVSCTTQPLHPGDKTDTICHVFPIGLMFMKLTDFRMLADPFPLKMSDIKGYHLR